ncbi:hypothetical protein EVAR_44184_1 [Eumeta japonica]|uniref:Uncharacterized protein n=1 Tax=Eumeta variegata TaxID=151549 RepID=A0A4C1VZH6_EUMVA|nr:hypothetical protein EVAR_44184_1 [Eumeta japonica]
MTCHACVGATATHSRRDMYNSIFITLTQLDVRFRSLPDVRHAEDVPVIGRGARVRPAAAVLPPTARLRRRLVVMANSVDSAGRGERRLARPAPSHFSLVAVRTHSVKDGNPDEVRKLIDRSVTPRLGPLTRFLDGSRASAERNRRAAPAPAPARHSRRALVSPAYSVAL